MLSPTQQLDEHSQEETAKMAAIHAALDTILGSGRGAQAPGATPSFIEEDGTFDPETGVFRHYLRADVDPIGDGVSGAGCAP